MYCLNDQRDLQRNAGQPLMHPLAYRKATRPSPDTRYTLVQLRTEEGNRCRHPYVRVHARGLAADYTRSRHYCILSGAIPDLPNQPSFRPSGE